MQVLITDILILHLCVRILLLSFYFPSGREEEQKIGLKSLETLLTISLHCSTVHLFKRNASFIANTNNKGYSRGLTVLVLLLLEGARF